MLIKKGTTVMKSPSIRSLLFVGILLALAFSPVSSAADESLQTVAEKSDFKATSTYKDVKQFIHALQKRTDRMQLEILCVSTEGRSIPLLIIGNPPPASPAELRNDKRAVIYIQANIHAGEVEGKEASLMLIRDILSQEKPPYLDNLVLLVAPVFNADGNEKISPQNRTNQVGPELGVGIRYNGQNLDLNRDGMKQESPEVTGLVQNVLNRWDPTLFIDCHTTNGSYHIEPVTYVGALNPNGDAALISYVRDTLLPSVQTTMKDKYDTLGVPYGNFMDFRDPEKGWSPAGPEPRYITNYIGLRNRMAILNENYAYADYRTRVLGCYHFLLSVLDFCSAHAGEMRDLVAAADRKTIQTGMNPTEKDLWALEYDVRPLKEPITLIGYEMEIEEVEGRRFPRVTKTDRIKTYLLPFYADYFAKKTIRRPYGYFLTVRDEAVIHKLLQHGVVVEQLLEPVKLEVETYAVKELKANPRLYQGHYMNSVTGEYAVETREFPAGTIFVGTGQPLGLVASYLLEAESDDGLVVWNYFDKYLASQWGRGQLEYPVCRLLTPTPLVKVKLGSGLPIFSF
ncbi:MAG: M14 family metallopeptidase [Acidobacteriota bacterium]